MVHDYIKWVLLVALTSLCCTSEARLDPHPVSRRGLESAAASLQFKGGGEKVPSLCTLHRSGFDAPVCFSTLISPRVILTAASCLDSEQRDSTGNHPIVKCNSGKESSLDIQRVFKGVKIVRVLISETSEDHEDDVAFVTLDRAASGPFATLEEGEPSNSQILYLLDEKELMKASSIPTYHPDGNAERESSTLNGSPVNCGAFAQGHSERNGGSDTSNVCGVVTRCRIYRDGIRKCVMIRIVKTWRQYRAMVQDTRRTPAAPSETPEETKTSTTSPLSPDTKTETKGTVASSVEPSQSKVPEVTPSPSGAPPAITTSPLKSAPTKRSPARSPATKSPRPSHSKDRRKRSPKPPKEHFPPCPMDLTPFRLRTIRETLKRIRRQMMNDKFRTVRTNFCTDFSPDTPDDQMNRPLHFAATYNANYSAWVVCKLGANTELKNKNSQTPLEVAVEHDSQETIQLLLSFNASTEPENKYGLRPLMSAAISNFQEAVDILILYGADVDAQDAHRKDTALHFAAGKGYINVAKMLLYAGASQNIKNARGETPADVLCKSRNTCSQNTISEFRRILSESTSTSSAT